MPDLFHFFCVVVSKYLEFSLLQYYLHASIQLQGSEVLPDSEAEHEYRQEVEYGYLEDSVLPLLPQVLDDIVQHEADSYHVDDY